MSTGYVECQSCGKPVLVMLPFVGCVFCKKCEERNNSSHHYWNDIGTEDFTPRSQKE